MGHPKAAEAFTQHRVQGKIFTFLGRKELTEMGVDIVGDKLKIVKEIARLRQIALTAGRNEVKFEKEEFRPGPCGDALPFGFPCCCCNPPPEQYILYNSKLQLKLQKLENPCLGACCGSTTTKNNIPLEMIRDVDSLRIVPCVCDCCGIDQAAVSITIEGGPGLDTSSDPLAGGAGGADAGQPGLGNLCSVFCSLMPCGACCCGDHDVSAPGAGDTTGGFIPKIKTHQKILRLKGTEVRATVDEITDAVEQNQMFVNSGGIGMF